MMEERSATALGARFQGRSTIESLQEIEEAFPALMGGGQQWDSEVGVELDGAHTRTRSVSPQAKLEPVGTTFHILVDDGQGGARQRGAAARGGEEDEITPCANLKWLPEIGPRPRGTGLGVVGPGWAGDRDDDDPGGVYWDSLSKEAAGAGSSRRPCSQAREALGRTPCCRTRRRACLCCCSSVALILGFALGIALQVLSLVTYTRLRLQRIDVHDACSIPMVVDLGFHIHNPSTVSLTLSLMDVTFRIRDKGQLGVVHLEDQLTVFSNKDTDARARLLIKPDRGLNIDLADLTRDTDYVLDLNVDVLLELLGGLPLHFFFSQQIPLNFGGGGGGGGGGGQEPAPGNATAQNCSSECWFTMFEDECCDPIRNISFGSSVISANLTDTIDAALNWFIGEGGVASVSVPFIRLVAVQQSQARDGLEVHIRPTLLATGDKLPNSGALRVALAGDNGVDMIRALIEGRASERWEVRFQESQLPAAEPVCASQQALANVRWSFSVGELMSRVSLDSIKVGPTFMDNLSMAYAAYDDNGANEFHVSMSCRNPLSFPLIASIPSVAVAIGSTPVPDRRVPEEAAFLSVGLDPVSFEAVPGQRETFKFTIKMLDAELAGRMAISPIVNGRNTSLRILGVDSNGGRLSSKVLQDSTYGLDIPIPSVLDEGIRSLLIFLTDLSVADAETPSDLFATLRRRFFAPGAKLFFQGNIPPVSFKAKYDGRNVAETSVQVNIGFLDVNFEAKTRLLNVSHCNPLITSLLFAKNFSPQVDVFIGNANPIPVTVQVAADLIQPNAPMWTPAAFSGVTAQGVSPCGLVSGTASGQVCNPLSSTLWYQLRGFSSTIMYGKQYIASGWTVPLNGTVPTTTCSPLPLSFEKNQAFAASPEQETVCTAVASQGSSAPFSHSGAAFEAGGVCACSRGIGKCSDGQGWACDAPNTNVKLCTEFAAQV